MESLHQKLTNDTETAEEKPFATRQYGTIAILIFIPLSMAGIIYSLFFSRYSLAFGNVITGALNVFIQTVEVLFLILLFIFILKKHSFVFALLFIYSILPLLNDILNYFFQILPNNNILLIHITFLILFSQSIVLFFYILFLKNRFNKNNFAKWDKAFGIFYTLCYLGLLGITATFALGGAMS